MKNSLKTLKNLLFTICILASTSTLLVSCENENFAVVDQSKDIETGMDVKMLTISNNEDFKPFTTDLMAGQHHKAGTLTVASDGTNLNVTYKTNCGETDTNSGGSWTLKATHLYVGDCDDMPTTKKGNPKIGKFPYKTEHGDGVNEYTYTIPLSDIGECFCIAAHAEVDCGECEEEDEDDEDEEDEGDTRISSSKSDDDNNDYCGEETAWASGEGFPGRSWAMYIEFCLEEDEVDE